MLSSFLQRLRSRSPPPLGGLCCARQFYLLLSTLTPVGVSVTVSLTMGGGMFAELGAQYNY